MLQSNVVHRINYNMNVCQKPATQAMKQDTLWVSPVPMTLKTYARWYRAFLELFLWGSESYPILYLWGSYLIIVVFQVFSWNFALLRQFLKQIYWNTYIHHPLCFNDFLLRENLTSTVKFSRKLTDATVSHTAYKLSTFSGL